MKIIRKNIYIYIYIYIYNFDIIVLLLVLLSGWNKHLPQFDIHVYAWHGGFNYFAGIMNTEPVSVLFLTSCAYKPLYGVACCISLSASYNFVSFTHRDQSALPLCICEICVLRYRYEWPGSLLFVCTGGQTWPLNLCVSPTTHW